MNWSRCCEIAAFVFDMQHHLKPIPIIIAALNKNLPDHLPTIHVQPLFSRKLQAARIHAEQVKYGRVQIGHIVSMLDGVETKFVRRAVNNTLLDAAAG